MKKRVIGIILAVMIMLSVFVITPNDTVEAATTTETCWTVKSFNSKDHWDIDGAKTKSNWKFTGQWIKKKVNGSYKWFLKNTKTGKLMDGFVVCSSGTYYLDSKNGMYTNKIFTCGNTDSSFYFADSSGKIAINQFKKTTKLVNTTKTAKVQQIYYFGADGASYSKWNKINGKYYYFSDYEARYDGNNGILFGRNAAYRQINNIEDSIFEINGKKYSFTTDGVMRTGWIQNGKNYYFAQADGALKSPGWQKINNKWYYFDKYWTRVYSCRQTISGKTYLFGSDGVMKTNTWEKVNSSWYYYGANGIMLKNTSKKIGNKVYKFNKNGVCTNP